MNPAMTLRVNPAMTLRVSPAMTLVSCTASQPSCAGLSRASTSLQRCNVEDVDGRDKPGHDVEKLCLSVVMPALVAGIHVFLSSVMRDVLSTVMPALGAGIHVFDLMTTRRDS